MILFWSGNRILTAFLRRTPVAFASLTQASYFLDMFAVATLSKGRPTQIWMQDLMKNHDFACQIWLKMIVSENSSCSQYLRRVSLLIAQGTPQST